MLGTLDLGLLQLRRDRPYDADSHLILQIENVLEIAFKALRPEMYACRGIHELTGDAHPARGFAHASFEDVAHAELTPDLLHVDRPALVSETRVSRDHEEPSHARERRDDLLDDAVCEIILLRVAAHVLEGKDCDGGFVGNHQGRPCGHCSTAEHNAIGLHRLGDVFEL